LFRICLHDKAGPGACRLASNYARPNSVALTIPASAGTGAYSYSYDVNGRISQVTYPSGFKADYNYTQLGYATQIVDGTLFTPYWTANTRDAELHLTQSTAGNGVVTNESFDGNTGRLLGLCATPDAGTCDGATANFAYTWDVIGNLKTRSDANDSVSETYCYDVLNRLTNSATGTGGATPSSCTASGTGIIDKIIGYDAAGLGNIASKSDVGTYSYGSGAGPHAVTAITGSYLGLTNPVLGYDANGNMTCVSSASSCGGTVARSVSYTSFNMAGSIVQGGATIGLSYDSEHNRVVQTQGSTTTTYLNDPVSGAMSEAVTSGGTTVWRDYIVADGGIVALRTTSPATGTATNWGDTTNAIWGNSSFKWYGTGVSVLYFTTDHLGSTSVLTDPSHVVQERDSYDAWGRRRNSNGTDNAACSITSLTTRGFTGQEMMDTVCAINLNARIYDPTIARMMLADPTIPNPMNGQSYNRYSYVNNRPLSATDPTGYWTLPGGATGTGPISNISLKYGVSQFGGLGSAGAIYGIDVTLGGDSAFVAFDFNSQSNAQAEQVVVTGTHDYGQQAAAASQQFDLQADRNALNSIEPPETVVVTCDASCRAAAQGAEDTNVIPATVTFSGLFSDNSKGLAGETYWGSLGGTFEFAPGWAAHAEGGSSGGDAIIGPGFGYSAKVSVDFPLPSVKLFEAKSLGYQLGLEPRVGGDLTIGLPVFVALDSIFGTGLFAPLWAVKGPAAVDVTAFAYNSNGQFNFDVDVSLVPAVGVSGVAGVGVDVRQSDTGP